jgi:pimeloyl-ACP methyl ester carboxylesterase
MQAAYDNLEVTYPNLHSKQVLAGIGHGAPEEAPQAVSAALIDWLRLSAGSSA